MISYSDDDFPIADLVLFEIYFLIGVAELPWSKRTPNQIWTFVTDESPLNTFAHYYNDEANFPNLDGIFNWSMTYR